MYIYLAESTSLKIGRAATVTSCNVHNLNRILWFDDIWSAKPMIPYDTASLFNQGKLDITADGVVEAVSGKQSRVHVANTNLGVMFLTRGQQYPDFQQLDHALIWGLSGHSW